MKNDGNKFTVGGLFSGVGGNELGFKEAGFKISWFNDNDDLIVVGFAAVLDGRRFRRSSSRRHFGVPGPTPFFGESPP